MGQKVNPHGLRAVLSKTGIPNGMQKKTLLITWWKTITSEHS